ncbi:MAG: hypothetical protein ABR568_23990 [Pyrinomonadaceae bacterium]
MRKQTLKRFTMLTVIVAVSFMTAVTSANGQSSRMVVANIPFDFNVGGKALTAGEYTVKAFTASGETLAISNKQSNNTAIRLTLPIHARKASERAKLVFHRYGQRYFLSEVWSAGERTGRQLLKSREERVIESQLAAIPSKSELASSAYEIVEIVAMVR